MSDLPLVGKTVFITGAARRIGAALARACAGAGANVVVHYHRSERQAGEVQREIEGMGRKAWLVKGDLAQPGDVLDVAKQAFEAGPVYALVNNAAVFEPLTLQQTEAADWERHMAVNLEAPFLLSQAFAAQLHSDSKGRIINILDWRALRPGADHFPYTVSKAALAGMTSSLATALAPRISVNGLALGAILPPKDEPPAQDILASIPAGRWGNLAEVEAALLFLLTGPAYITGEIVHLDGGRHLI